MGQRRFAHGDRVLTHHHTSTQTSTFALGEFTCEDCGQKVRAFEVLERPTAERVTTEKLRALWRSTSDAETLFDDHVSMLNIGFAPRSRLQSSASKQVGVHSHQLILAGFHQKMSNATRLP